ncbi:MAG: ribonuclease HII [Spirochaetaceae bacterium]|nr:ribonuclease HII [Spirochaetaceae bacterium]
MVCGLDEAGRGPLAGPVYAAAAALPDGFPVEMLDDSKKTPEKKRLEVAAFIKSSGAAYGVGFASHTEIDEINILQASLLAMERAFAALLADFPDWAPRINEAVADGLFIPKITIPGNALFNVRALVKADALVPSVMAASILAKTERDAEMARLALLYPEYGFEKHKGYPTKSHRLKIKEFGPSPVHRLSFRLLKEESLFMDV